MMFPVMRNIQKTSPFATKQLGEKLNKVLRASQRETAEKDARRGWYLELALAGIIGASVALAFVVAHGMLTTSWTW